MIIKVDDGFCEWSYEIQDLSDYSIAEIVKIITNNTKSMVIKSELTKSYYSRLNELDEDK